MFGLHDPLHGRMMSSSKHLKDEPLLGHHHHNQIHPISVRNWMQSSIADQPVKSVYDIPR